MRVVWGGWDLMTKVLRLPCAARSLSQALSPSDWRLSPEHIWFRLAQGPRESDSAGQETTLWGALFPEPLHLGKPEREVIQDGLTFSVQDYTIFCTSVSKMPKWNALLLFFFFFLSVECHLWPHLLPMEVEFLWCCKERNFLTLTREDEWSLFSWN